MSLLTPTSSKSLRRGFTAALIASAIALAGCSAPADTTSSSSASASDGSSPSAAKIGTVPKNAAAAAALPASVKSSGVLRVATGAYFPPMEYFAPDNKTILGFDADLSAALAQALGVDAKLTNVDFDGIIGGLAAERYDVGITAMADKKTRQEKASFVDYLKSGVSIMVVKGNPQTITGRDSLCGLKVGTEKGSTGDLTAEATSKTCTADGKKPVDNQAFSSQADAVQALQAGRVDAVIALDVTLAYNVAQSNGAFELAGKPFDTIPMGIAVAKGNTQMLKSAQLALKAVQDSGVYDQLLAKYGLTNNALTGAPINAGK